MPRSVVSKSSDEILSKPITVAVLGSGGREHALAWKLAQSSLCSKVLVVPGNDGIAAAEPKIVVKKENATDFEALSATLKKTHVDLIVVGPDDLLALGVVDALTKEGFAVFGPTQAAARLESSKAFAKEIMRLANVPTAKHVQLASGDQEQLGTVAAELGGYPIVLKYDGLALGKGVRICADEGDAQAFLKEVFEENRFTRATAKKKETKALVIAEQFLTGHEVSLFALTDGERFVGLEPVCDHKRLLDGNMGPNTGGMGAYSPVPWLTKEQVDEISKTVFPPLLRQMREARVPFKGLLYAGLMVKGRDFWVLEFNARFGDPETQALMPRLESDLLPVLWGIANDSFERHLNANPLRWRKSACVNIVAASKGYPDAPETGFAITGLEQAKGAQVFLAGVKDQDGALVTSGGRVLSVSAVADSLAEAGATAQGALKNIQFEGMQFRKDVGRVSSHY